MSLERILSVSTMVSGVPIALIAQLLVFPVAGLQMMLWQNLVLAYGFSGLSLLDEITVLRFLARPATRC